MNSFPGSSGHGPMELQRYNQLLQEKLENQRPASSEILEPESYKVPVVSSEFATELLKEALDRRLTGGELMVLFEEASLHDVGRTAHQLRLKRSNPEQVTYIIDRNVTYTNVCYVDCGFCAFNRHQGDGDHFLLSQKDILEKCRSVIEAGGSQILLQGGHHPKKRIDYYEEMLEGIKRNWPQMWIHGFSPSEVQHFARLNGLSINEILRRLKDAGMDSVPGGGAEILSDRVRRILAPGKAMAHEWIDIMEQAHFVGLPTTATMMFSHLETFAERVEHLLRVRNSQDKTRGYTAFIPWTFQPSNTPLLNKPELKRVVMKQGFLGSTDYLRTLAISRIALDNFANIQASWVTQGKSVGQLTLLFGANDLGSTMMEESVVSAAGVSHPLTRMDIEEMITGAGFKSALRDNGYNIQG